MRLAHPSLLVVKIFTAGSGLSLAKKQLRINSENSHQSRQRGRALEPLSVNSKP